MNFFKNFILYSVVFQAVALLLLFLTNMYLAHATDGVQFRYFVNANGNMTDTKGLSVGKQYDLGVLRYKHEIGFWFDTREGAMHSPFGFAGLGVEPQCESVYVNFFQNVGGIGFTDSYLGGHFQFQEELGFGFRDQRDKTSVGVFYKHISNAGLTEINRGRDYFGVQVMIPW